MQSWEVLLPGLVLGGGSCPLGGPGSRSASPLPWHPLDWKVPGPTGSLWSLEFTCDLESKGPAKEITMRNVTRHTQLSLMRPDLGNWCQETHRKARWYFPGSWSTMERSPGPLSCPFLSRSVPGRLRWEDEPRD